MVITFLSQLVGALLALLTIRMYTELLSPDQLGIAMLALGGMAFFDATISSSVNQIIFFYGSRIDLQRRIFQFLLAYKNKTTLIGAIVIGIIFTISLTLPKDAIFTWLTIFLSIILYLIIEPSRSSFFSFLNVVADRKNYGTQVILDAVFTLFTTFTLLYYFNHWSSILLGILASRYLSVYTNIYLIRKNNRLLSEPTNHKVQFPAEAKQVYKHVKPIVAMGVIGWLSGFSDRYIVATALNLRDTGYYSVATSLVGKPYMISTAALTAHFRPSLYTAVAESNTEQMRKTELYWLISAIVIGLLGILLFVGFNDFLVQILLSSKYKGHIENILWIVAASMTLTIMTHAIDNHYLARGIANKLYRLQLYLLFIPLISIGLGAYGWGMLGAVSGKLVSDFVKFASTFCYSRIVKE